MVKEMGQTSLHMLPSAPLAIRYINQLILLLSSHSKPLVFILISVLVLRQFGTDSLQTLEEFIEIFTHYANLLVN